MSIQHPPDRASPPAPEAGSPGYKRTVGILAVVLALAYIDRQLLVVLIEPVKHELSLSDTEVGFLTGGAFALLYAVLGVPVARLADRTSRRTVLSVSVLVWSAMTCLCGVTQNVWQLVLARMGVGAGESGCIPPAHSLIAAVTPPTRLASAMAAYSVGIPIGVLTGMVLGGWLGEWIGWRAALIVVGAPGLLVAALVRFGLTEPPRARGDGDAPKSPPLFASLATLLGQGAFVLILGGSAFVSLATGVLLVWTPSLLARTTDLGVGSIGTWLGLIIGLGGAAGMMLGGFLGDRFAARGEPHRRALTAAATGLLAAATSALMLQQEQVTALLLAMILPILFGMAPTGVTNAVVQDLAPTNLRAFAASVLIFVNTVLGIAMGPLIVGIVSDTLGARDQASALKIALITVVPGCYLIGSLCHFAASVLLARRAARPGGHASAQPR